MRRIYIAGPMTGLPEFNFPAFHAAAKAWRDAGWEVVNPAEEFDGDTERTYREYVEHDMRHIVGCDAIAMLPGWDGPGARGSVWERAVADWMGLLIYDATQPAPPPEEIPNPPPETILEEAQRLVHGRRGADYGHPALDFGRTAGMASALWAHKMKDGETITRQDVAAFMILVKLSRLAHRFKRDSVVDIAGYAETAAMCAEWEAVHGA